MRLRPLLLTVPLLLIVPACGSDEDVTVQEPAAAATTAPAAALPSVSAAVPSIAVVTPGVGNGAPLRGTLGEPGDPEAYEIGLLGAGGPVTTLPAGTYSITVDDQSVMHNFHLSGPGVDEATGVSAKEKRVFTVTLTAGTYEFVCDPHSSMSGSFTVT